MISLTEQRMLDAYLLTSFGDWHAVNCESLIVQGVGFSTLACIGAATSAKDSGEDVCDGVRGSRNCSA